MNRSYYAYLFLVFLIGLIFFDALQQKYYVDTFQPTDEIIPLSDFLISHAWRWGVWLVCAIPFGLVVWRENKKGPLLKSRSSFAALLATLVVSILSVTLISMAEQGLGLSWSVFLEFLEFFVYQKGLVFLLASLILIQGVKNYQSDQVIEQQDGKISLLTEENLGLKSNKRPHLNIKTGFKLRPIPLSKVLWIEADDYCCRVYTKDDRYTIRRSLKSFESELSTWRFVRVHRKALVNLDYLEAVHLHRSVAELTDGTEVPISNQGARLLKQKMASLSIAS